MTLMKERPMSEAQKDCDAWCSKIEERKYPAQSEDRVVVQISGVRRGVQTARDGDSDFQKDS